MQSVAPELLIGPSSGLVIALIFAFSFKGMFEKLLTQSEARTERLVQVFEAEVRACEDRYKSVLQELLTLKTQIKSGL